MMVTDEYPNRLIVLMLLFPHFFALLFAFRRNVL